MIERIILGPAGWARRARLKLLNLVCSLWGERIILVAAGWRRARLKLLNLVCSLWGSWGRGRVVVVVPAGGELMICLEFLQGFAKQAALGDSSCRSWLLLDQLGQAGIVDSSCACWLVEVLEQAKGKGSHGYLLLEEDEMEGDGLR